MREAVRPASETSGQNESSEKGWTVLSPKEVAALPTRIGLSVLLLSSLYHFLSDEAVQGAGKKVLENLNLLKGPSDTVPNGYTVQKREGPDGKTTIQVIPERPPLYLDQKEPLNFNMEWGRQKSGIKY